MVTRSRYRALCALLGAWLLFNLPACGGGLEPKVRALLAQRLYPEALRLVDEALRTTPTDRTGLLCRARTHATWALDSREPMDRKRSEAEATLADYDRLLSASPDDTALLTEATGVSTLLEQRFRGLGEPVALMRRITERLDVDSDARSRLRLLTGSALDIARAREEALVTRLLKQTWTTVRPEQNAPEGGGTFVLVRACDGVLVEPDTRTESNGFARGQVVRGARQADGSVVFEDTIHRSFVRKKGWMMKSFGRLNPDSPVWDTLTFTREGYRTGKERPSLPAYQFPFASATVVGPCVQEGANFSGHCPVEYDAPVAAKKRLEAGCLRPVPTWRVGAPENLDEVTATAPDVAEHLLRGEVTDGLPRAWYEVATAPVQSVSFEILPGHTVEHAEQVLDVRCQVTFRDGGYAASQCDDAK